MPQYYLIPIASSTQHNHTIAPNGPIDNGEFLSIRWHLLSSVSCIVQL